MLLAIDTASDFMSLALHDGQRVIAEQTALSPRQQTTQLTAQIQAMLTGQGIGGNALQAIGIAQGPGAYSGLRAGFGVAKGLATALSIPLIPVPTLDILLQGTFQPLNSAEMHLVAVLQAGRRRIIAGVYRWDAKAKRWTAHGLPLNTTWRELLDIVAALPGVPLIMGEISPEALPILEAHNQPVLAVSGSLNLRRAGFLGDLAWERLRRGGYETDLALVNPVYLKAP